MKTTLRLVRILQDLRRHWAQARRRRRDIRLLSALDDEQLWDIGLTRGDIAAFGGEHGRQRPTTSIAPLDARRGDRPVSWSPWSTGCRS